MEIFKTGIIGGGAAGLMAAISAAESGCQSVVLFEGNSRCGTKILMSGGTRCNVTNQSVRAEDFFGGNRNFIKNVLNAFSDRAAVEFFKTLGVDLKLEPAGKYFPVDNSASSVLGALLKRLEELNVKIYLSTKIEDIRKEENGFILSAKRGDFRIEKVILTTGGKSYPSTGSDGGGYLLAKKLGHSLKPTFPALTPILLNEPKLSALSGITIPAKLTIMHENRKHIEIENSLLLTHVGISGPAALNISREVERLKNGNMKLLLNFLPSYSYESLARQLKEQAGKNSDKHVLGFFRELLPSNLCNNLFDLSGVSAERKFNLFSKYELKRIVTVFTSYELKVTGVKGFAQAEVTAGGVPLEEVRYQTMESKLCKGLFLAGEILDVDGLIGGYNFQWAWSTGYIAGRGAQKEY